MKAYVTSIGEPTTELCIWALERQGFDVCLIKDEHSSLAAKLEFIYNVAEDDFLRVDSDIIVNKNMTPALLNSLEDIDIWWWQFVTFDWFKQDLNHSMAFIKREAIPALRDNIAKFRYDLRPETQMSRIDEFYNPRRMATHDDKIVGLHGFGISDIENVKQTKYKRRQLYLYDFELAERLNNL